MGKYQTRKINACVQNLHKKAEHIGSSKIHNKYEVLPPFRPTVDTTNTPYYGIVKDSFDAANKIQKIPRKLFDSGYRFVRFDITRLLTKVPLAKIIDIVLERVYSEKLVIANLTNLTMKKLLKGACSKTAFTFNDKIYKQMAFRWGLL